MFHNQLLVSFSTRIDLNAHSSASGEFLVLPRPQFWNLEGRQFLPMAGMGLAALLQVRSAVGHLARVLQPGYRLVTSVVIACLAFLLSSPHPDTRSRIVFAWDTGVTFLLALIAMMMWLTAPDQTLQRARKEESSNIVVLLATMLAVAGALVTIGHDLPKVRGMSKIMLVFDISESIIGVFLAWLLLHISYALHYAKVYYADTGDADTKAFRRGLAFPGDNDVVDYWDFVYYAFTIAMCYQTSDVTGPCSLRSSPRSFGRNRRPRSRRPIATRDSVS